MNVELYKYVPNAGAAGLFVVLFAIAFCLHAWSMCRTHSWFYIPLLVGTIFEAVGYAFRIYSHFNVTSVAGFAGQSVLILVAAPLLAATIYMILGRIMRALRAEKHSIIPPKWLTGIFVTGDVFCFLLQATGGGLQVKAADDIDSIKLGKNIILGGLILQVVLFGVFLLVAAVFHARLHGSVQDVSVPWRKQMIVLFLSSACIMARNVVRIVEYAQGFDGYIMSHEAFIYVFDALLMLAAVVLLWARYAGSFIQQVRRTEAIGLVERGDTHKMGETYGSKQQGTMVSVQ